MKIKGSTLTERRSKLPSNELAHLPSPDQMVMQSLERESLEGQRQKLLRQKPPSEGSQQEVPEPQSVSQRQEPTQTTEEQEALGETTEPIQEKTLLEHERKPRERTSQHQSPEEQCQISSHMSSASSQVSSSTQSTSQAYSSAISYSSIANATQHVQEYLYKHFKEKLDHRVMELKQLDSGTENSQKHAGTAMDSAMAAAVQEWNHRLRDYADRLGTYHILANAPPGTLQDESVQSFEFPPPPTMRQTPPETPKSGISRSSRSLTNISNGRLVSTSQNKESTEDLPIQSKNTASSAIDSQPSPRTVIAGATDSIPTSNSTNLKKKERQQKAAQRALQISANITDQYSNTLPDPKFKIRAGTVSQGLSFRQDPAIVKSKILKRAASVETEGQGPQQKAKRRRVNIMAMQDPYNELAVKAREMVLCLTDNMTIMEEFMAQHDWMKLCEESFDESQEKPRLFPGHKTYKRPSPDAHLPFASVNSEDWSVLGLF